MDTDSEPVFGNYFCGENGPLIRQLQQLLKADSATSTLYLWGPPGCGRTHLLQACCHQAGQQGLIYLYSVVDQHNGPAQGFERINPKSLVCLDDLNCIAARPDWQQTVFTLYERLLKGGGRLVLAANAPPAKIGLQLEDLVSRLTAGGVYRIEPLSGQDRSKAFKMRAKRRGIRLDDAVVSYILNHYQRDARSLFKLLERIDSQSLIEQRRVTIPFIKKYL